MSGQHADRGTSGSSALRVVPDDAVYLPVHIGFVFKQRRLRAGLTQEQAAVQAGLTRGAIAKLEAAEYPDPHLSTLLGLMRTYRLASIDELLGDLPSTVVATAWANRASQ